MLRSSALLITGLLAGTSAGEAQRAPGSVDPLVAVADADPLELARVASRVGDRAVIDRLGETVSPEVRLAATRAAPWLRAPEDALAPLAALACGRDPHLAPAAAAAALDIARALDGPSLDRREVLRDGLRGPRRKLSRLAEDSTARRDIRLAAALAADALGALGVPA